MTPADKVYAAFDDGKHSPQQLIIKLTGIAPAEVYRWSKPKKKGGCDGLIPARWQSKLLWAAKKHKKKLSPIDLVMQ